MTTEIVTEVTYQVQNQDKFSDRWFNGGTITTEKIAADAAINRLRKTYPETAFRLLAVTTTTEVIG